MKYLFIAIFFLSFSNLFSQSMLFRSGVNITSYDYKNSANEKNTNIQSSTGNFYEIAYSFPIAFKKRGVRRGSGMSSRLNSITSININEYNATGGNVIDNYDWDTSYLGIKSNLSYTILGNEDFFELALKGGVSLSKILNGKQKIGGNSYDLNDNQEFNKLMFAPNIGLDIKFGLYNDIFMNFGIDFSKVMPVTRNPDQSNDPEVIKNKESLSFNNTQLAFGVFINL